MNQILEIVLCAIIFMAIIIANKGKNLSFLKNSFFLLLGILSFSGCLYFIFKAYYNYIYLAPSGYYMLFTQNQRIAMYILTMLLALVVIILKIRIRIEKKKNTKKYYIFTSIISLIISLFSFILIWGSNWLLENFGMLDPEKILYFLSVPMDGTNSEVVQQYITESLIFCITLSVIFVITIVIISKFRFQIEGQLFHKKIVGCVTIKWGLVLMLPLLLIISVRYAYMNLEFNKYIKNMKESSTYIEENYISPLDVEITFPEEKRNLIYIFMESMETTYMAVEDGGAQPKNLIPELTEIAKNNLSFSNNELLSGMTPAPKTGWTMAGMVSQTAGIPLKVPTEYSNIYGESAMNFLPGAYSIGEILEEAGYNQTLLLGSDAAFGGRTSYFTQHGNYHILDYYTAIEDGIILEDYKVFWGFEDQILYRYAKQELERLARENTPFNFTMLTVDTHHSEGYLCELCQEEYEDQYANVLSCASRQLEVFISWIEKQDFYENTTIIVVGDHPSMVTGSVFSDMPEGYVRRVYNAFINSAIETDNVINREFSPFDMFPTTLASLGVVIEGDRLGLGTNLFSDSQTLTEMYGVEIVHTELNKHNEYYNKKFLHGKE
jgi:Phosphoglycerol transferase and related proteins, alkaline phosphatase superfamily